MIAINDILISEEIFDKKFVCNLSKCKGECCIAGDSGAPLKLEELDILEKEYDKFKDFITEDGQKTITENGLHSFDIEDKTHKTMLIENGPCAYINYDQNGIAVCGIEKAYLAGKTSFRKPISCHLYPIRESKVGSLTAINYEEWEICSDACALGKELKIPVFKFLKEPIIRAYGSEFFEIMDEYFKESNTL